ncbi:sensor domain-containing diguanylate cyclase [Sphingomonas japonica]|uniref:Diguanylate cyclase (GGDEF)-like protein/PAS domain S-box-containing protein n=1 Tax=Sphingomonas japonica TaxID=511662 RepID=A0ABX0TY88_9SPHN|nr:sensor domain-containing diguanylate cyclase [Sphingomonas japonica]NIJ23265.1 diguanylate cyclase (GGDEF)-like protein/PAS domain S-box-containing protein [Sphingomonas japonica]
MLPLRLPSPKLRTAILVGIAYTILAAAAIAFTRLSDNVALIWFATAPLLAALTVWPRRSWWMFILAGLIGSMTATLVTSPYTALAGLFAIANVGEAVIAALLLRRWALNRELFLSTRSIPWFVLWAGFVAPALSGAVVAAALFAAHGTDPLTTWGNWLIGHGLGSVIAMPLAVLVLRGGAEWKLFAARADAARAIGVATLVIAVSAAVFSQDRFPLLFLVIMPVLVATFTLRSIGAAASIVIVAVIGAAFTLGGHGPIGLVRGDEALQLQFFQFYVGTLFVIALPVATTLIERDTLLRALSTSEARYRLVAEHASDIMITVDPLGRVEYVSPSIRELGFADPLALYGTEALLLVAEPDRERVRATYRQAIAAPDRTFRVEYRALRASGETSWFEISTRAVLDDLGQATAMVSVARDLSQRKAREEELERAASLDPMTGLLNREVFRRSVGLALHRARRQPDRRAALALIDIDHFKGVNDTHGHAAGDTAILVLADLMRSNLRAADQIGRIGGEEFAILFDGVDADVAQASCERLRVALSRQPVPCAAGTFRMTASIGVVAVTPGTQIDRLFALADQALYAAKRGGRDRVERATA